MANEPKYPDWKARAENAEAERDALAAHVETGKAVIANLLEVHKEELSEWESAKIAEAGEWVAEAPTTFAHLKARWQVEALDFALAQMRVVMRDEPTTKALSIAISDVEELRRLVGGGE